MCFLNWRKYVHKKPSVIIILNVELLYILFLRWENKDNVMMSIHSYHLCPVLDYIKIVDQLDRYTDR